MATRKTTDKAPELYHYGFDLTKEWYVGFRRTNPLTKIRKPFQVRLGINFCTTLKERKQEGAAVIDIVTKALNNSWNPFTENIEDFIKRASFSEQQLEEARLQKEAEDAERYSFSKMLWHAYNRKLPYFSPKSKLDIAGVLRFAEKAAMQLGIERLHIGSVTRMHAKQLLEKIAENRQLEYDKEGEGKRFTGNTYNKYNSYLKLIFSELEEEEFIDYNPCSKIKPKKELTTNVHRHATERERQLIVNELKLNHINFYYVVAALHGTGIRPAELLALQIENLDDLNQCFNVLCDDGKSKTLKTRKVPIPGYLYDYISKMVAPYRTTSKYYIFSQDFMPGEKKKKRDYATRTWQEIVKIGLGIDVTLYSFKGLGGEDKRKAGVAADSVSAGYGHSSMNMTKIYLHGEQDRINKELIEKTPAL